MYLIEPYNAYQKPARKKHWTEVAEEEALYVRMVMEHQAIMQSMAVNSNAPAGGVGGGYNWEDVEYCNFSYSPTTGVGPLLVTFVNLTDTPNNDTFLWSYGSGSLTSALVTAPPLTYTQTGSYTITLNETSSTGFKSTKSNTVTVVAPTITPHFTVNTSSYVAPYIVTFTNTSTRITGSGDSLNYKWIFGDGTTSSLANPTHTYQTGSFNVSLEISESIYGITSMSSSVGAITGIVPTLNAAFTFETSSADAPSIASFTNTTNYNGTGALTYLWTYGSGSLTTSSLNADLEYLDAGSYTASLQVTESLYNLTSFVTASWVLA